MTSPTLVILAPGLGMCGDSFAPVCRVLPDGVRMMAISRPGTCGRNGPPRKVTLADEVHRLTRAAARRPGESVILVAHSMSALVAEALVRTQPGVVDALVLVDGSTATSEPAPATGIRAKVSRSAQRSLYAVLSALPGKLPTRGATALVENAAFGDMTRQVRILRQEHRRLDGLLVEQLPAYRRERDRHGHWAQAQQAVADLLRADGADVHVSPVMGSGHLVMRDDPLSVARGIIEVRDRLLARRSKLAP
ncbi:alpha/beta fold hydrolase [Devriesea agamarum]|uniref:alpha/beta fold hydrolase n=1 Tax=Devriesea agamarum TaxID=472569 RepID=UPI00071D785E|nr:alpha/beta hydrolase [Devriesea agamarum]